MLKKIALALALSLVAAAAFAQAKKITAADFGGTWNIEMMSHQIALVVEPKDETRVDATLMIMGKDQPLTGEIVNGELLLKGVKPEGGAEGGGPNVHTVPASEGGKPIVVRLQEDGTITGEMQTQMGAAKFTGEKLKTKKKG